MPLTRKGAGGIMFLGCPSVRTGILLPRNLKNPLVDFFYHNWPRGAPWAVDELIRFWARSAQGRRSKVNELGLNMLFLPRYREISRTPGWIFIKLGTEVHLEESMNWLDFGRDPPKVKDQWTWSKYAIFTSLPRNLKNPWVDFHQTWHGCTMRSRWTD